MDYSMVDDFFSRGFVTILCVLIIDTTIGGRTFKETVCLRNALFILVGSFTGAMHINLILSLIIATIGYFIGDFIDNKIILMK